MAEKQIFSKSGRSPLRFALWIVLSFLILVADQASKFYFEHTFEVGTAEKVAPHFNFVLAHNHGAAFSFLADAGGWQKYLFLGISFAVIVFLLTALWKHSGKTLFSLAASLLIAGAAGNLIDRMVYGYVIDFLDFYWNSLHWPAFNIADIAITCGAAAFIIDEFRRVSKK